jgi:CheY-like chemotaxis protein
MGYAVNAVTGGAEAIGLYRLALEKGQPFEAVIVAAEAVDDIDGLEILENLRQLDPKVQVIVSGEDPEEPMMADCHRFGFRNRLVRPYGEAELAAVLSD